VAGDNEADVIGEPKEGGVIYIEDLFDSIMTVRILATDRPVFVVLLIAYA